MENSVIAKERACNAKRNVEAIEAVVGSLGANSEDRRLSGKQSFRIAMRYSLPVAVADWRPVEKSPALGH
jgi:hypothetical protein